MELKVNYIPDDAKCNTHHTMDNGKPASITIHWTGPLPDQSPEQVRDYWIKSNGEPSAHFIIKDSKVLQCWPINKAAWHCGCRQGNYSSIGIEVIPEDKEGKFSKLSIKSLRDLIATLPCDLPIVRHYDWSGKECPKYYLDHNRWEQLLEEIKRA